VFAQGDPVYVIFDQPIHDIAAKEPWFKEALDLGCAKKADTFEQMAQAMKIPASTIAKTIDDYNAAAAGRKKDAFGRADFGIAPLNGPPFFFTQVQSALLSTQGGLMVDDKFRVVKNSGSSIANLYAGGGAVAGISGRTGGVGYASGSGLLHAIGMGYLIGVGLKVSRPKT
jgi:fumarate reductase flavoprotein subunit